MNPRFALCTLLSVAAFAGLENLRLVAFGDAQFDRGIERYLERHKWESLFTPTQQLRDQSDVSLVNLETPLLDSTEQQQWTPKDKPIVFASNPRASRELATAKFTHVSLANNHSLDYGIPGLRSTFNSLQSAGLIPLGASLDSDPCSPVLVRKGIHQLALLALMDLPGDSAGPICRNSNTVIHNVQRLQKQNIPAIVFVHWGEEYAKVPSARQVQLAEKLQKAGVQAVIGHHPHVVQGTPESSAPNPVWYSLGNFIFDQQAPWTLPSQAAILEWDSQGKLHHQTIPMLRTPWTSKPRVIPEN